MNEKKLVCLETDLQTKHEFSCTLKTSENMLTVCLSIKCYWLDLLMEMVLKLWGNQVKNLK